MRGGSPSESDQSDAAERPGAVRAFLRRIHESSLLAVTASPDFAAAPGDELIGVWWVRNAEAAVALEAEIAALLKAAHVHVNRDGFSAFPADKVTNLVRTAMTHLGVPPLPKAAFRQVAKQAWTHTRCARLGFLIGTGLEAKEIAIDPAIATAPESVYRQASRLGLSFQEAPRGQVRVRVRREDLVAFDRVAKTYGCTRESLARRLVAAAPALVPALFGTRARAKV